MSGEAAEDQVETDRFNYAGGKLMLPCPLIHGRADYRLARGGFFTDENQF